MYAMAREYRAMRRCGLDFGVLRGAWVGLLEEGVCLDFAWGLCVGEGVSHLIVYVFARQMITDVLVYNLSIWHRTGQIL